MNKKELARETVNCLVILKDLAVEGKDLNNIEVKLWLEKYYQFLLDYHKGEK
jgi:hypothetical protein